MNSARRLIESVFSKPSVFKNREALYPEYVPTVLPHREEQIKQLAEIFKSLIISPGSISQRAMLVGGVGTGKTVTARAFGRELRALARSRGLDLRYIHVNCHRDRTLFEVITEIARQLGAPVPFRGLSAQEIFVALLNYMERENTYALVTLDEFDYLINIAGNDAVYFLVRIYDEYPEIVKRVSYIFIARDLLALRRLDPATESYILKHVVRFNPYTSSELFDILSARRSEAFYEGTVPDNVLKYIAEYEGIDKGGGGNARAALEALLLAGEAADHDGLGRVTVEHVRRALGIVNPDIVIVNDLLVYLHVHELLILKAAIRVLRRSGNMFVRIGDVEKEYIQLCEEINEKPRKHTQVYEYVNNLKKMGIIQTRVSGKGFRGRSTLIGIGIGPLEALERKIDEILMNITGKKP